MLKKILITVASSLLLACTPLLPTPGVAVDANIGKEVTTTEQLVAVQSNLSAGDNASVAHEDSVRDTGTLQKDSAVLSASKIGAAKSSKSKAVVDSHKENTVQAEEIDDVISTDKNQDIVVGANSTVNIVESNGLPWYFVIVGLMGLFSVAYWYNKRNTNEFVPPV